MKKTKMMKKNYEFRKVLSTGNYYSGKYIEAFIKKDNQKEINYLGIAISSKIANAVKRNKIKRLIRESYNYYEEYLKNGYCVIFLWKKKQNTKEATFKNIKEDINYILKKSKMIEEKIWKNYLFG